MTTTLGIIIPVGAHHATLVGDAVESIMRGSMMPDSVMVVDDHAHPPVVPVIGDPIVRHAALNGSARGRSVARNCGARLAGTDWLYWLDADDLLLSHAVRDFHAALVTHPLASLIYADYQWSSGRELSPRPAVRVSEPFSRELLRTKMIGNIGAFMRRDRFEAVGGFDEARDYGEEFDLWLRYALNPAVQVVKVDRPFFHARKGLHSVDRAGSHWTAACERIRHDVAQGMYAEWETR